MSSPNPDARSLLPADVHALVAHRTAPIMFVLATSFLVCQAILIVLWVDVPSLREKTLEVDQAKPEVASVVEGASAVSGESIVEGESIVGGNAITNEVQSRSIEFEQAPILAPTTPAQLQLQRVSIALMAITWPFVILESIYHWIIRPKTRAMRWFHFYGFLFCLCPSLRMCARSVEMDGRMWLPGISWSRPNRRLRRRLEQTFSVPMIGIALLILPVLMVEFLLKEQVARYGSLRLALHVGTGVIWFAFAAEFILMVSIAEKKLEYIRKNWVDLATIILPFFSFLRSMQAVRGSRLAKLAKIPQLTKLVRAYRLRGTALKAFRALILLDVSTRLLRTRPEKQLARLREELTATNREARLIRLMIARLEREITESEETYDPITNRQTEEPLDFRE